MERATDACRCAGNVAISPSLQARSEPPCGRARVPSYTSSERPAMRISEALDRYLVQLAADGRSPHTINQAKRHVWLLISTMGDRDVETVKPEDIARFLASPAVTKTNDGKPRR